MYQVLEDRDRKQREEVCDRTAQRAADFVTYAEKAPMKVTLLIAGLACLVSFADAKPGQVLCEFPPVWKEDGVDPVASSRGKVVALTLFDAT
eukprot:Seg1349.4 transcript_id=Seg1349.4/GoldUCD/mRNA.D3Y31 product="hypothetical protein" protein_id=Seg1349.4/GoldUCD/D3Y31